jgi:uncharacterized membrane protein
VTKGVSYRVLGTLFTTAVSYAMTGSARMAMLLGSADFVLKVLLFWGHERVWARVRWGCDRKVLFAPPPGGPSLTFQAAPQPIYPPREG